MRFAQRRQSGSWARVRTGAELSQLGEIDKLRRVVMGFEKPHQIHWRHRHGHVVAERMRVDELGVEQLPVKQHVDPACGIIDDCKRRHRAGRDAEHLPQHLHAAERKAAAGTEMAAQRLEVDRLAFERCQKPETLFPVSEKKIFGVSACKGAAQNLGFLDRKKPADARGFRSKFPTLRTARKGCRRYERPVRRWKTTWAIS